MIFMWPPSEQTKKLLCLAKAGNAAAIDALMQRHRHALRRLIQLRMDRRLQQRLDVSDIVQETLIEANRRLREYLDDPPMEFHLWLRQIARDRIIDAHRRHRGTAKRSLDREQVVVTRSNERSSIDIAQELRDWELTPCATAVHREIIELIDAHIDPLGRTRQRDHYHAAL